MPLYQDVEVVELSKKKVFKILLGDKKSFNFL